MIIKQVIILYMHNTHAHSKNRLPHVYGHHVIVVRELLQLVAPGEPKLEQKRPVAIYNEYT